MLRLPFPPPVHSFTTLDAASRGPSKPDAPGPELLDRFDKRFPSLLAPTAPSPWVMFLRNRSNGNAVLPDAGNVYLRVPAHLASSGRKVCLFFIDQWPPLAERRFFFSPGVPPRPPALTDYFPTPISFFSLTFDVPPRRSEPHSRSAIASDPRLFFLYSFLFFVFFDGFPIVRWRPSLCC